MDDNLEDSHLKIFAQTEFSPRKDKPYSKGIKTVIPDLALDTEAINETEQIRKESGDFSKQSSHIMLKIAPT